ERAACQGVNRQSRLSASVYDAAKLVTSQYEWDHNEEPVGIPRRANRFLLFLRALQAAALFAHFAISLKSARFVQAVIFGGRN
ncbi:MAG: hypothetical protein SH868_10885, partial [Bythopirellula sp.]|nr:hypothetical protein [Bythopirellula sp.]